ncbi:MAG: multiheme c-type cytochrome [Terriglobales bacterium]
MPASAFPSAAYCGHCHAAAYRQWQESLHRNAFREPFYKKNVDLLNETKGIEYSRHCEGCHNPIALFSGALTPHATLTRSFDGDGITCSVCHSITKLQPMRGNGAYVMGMPAVMTDAGGRRMPGMVPDSEILAHPDLHARAVMQPFYRSAEFCGTCHNSNLPGSLTGYKWLRGFGTYDEWQASAYSHSSPLPFYDKPVATCQTCHMAPEPAGPGEMAEHAGNIASHRWLGGNTAVPFYYGMKEQLQRTQEFLSRQKIAIDIFALQPAGSSRLLGAPGDPAATVSPGETVVALVVVKNTGLGHSLVPEQRDIYEAWLEFAVAAADGRRVWQSGGILPGGELDPAAHSFTSDLVAADGSPLRQHEIWLRRAVAFDNTILPGRSALVRYEFRVPKDASGPLLIHASVQYRHFNQHFLGYVLGASHPPYPIVEMAAASRTVPVGRGDPGLGGTPNAEPAWEHWNDFGIALLDQGEFLGARSAFQRVVALRPGYADGHINLAIADLGLSDFAAGRRDTSVALALARGAGSGGTRGVARALYYRGLAERDLDPSQGGSLPASIRDLAAAVQGYLHSRDALRELGRSEYLAGEIAPARRSFAALLASDPNDLLAHFYLAVLYRRAGQTQRAAEHAAAYEREKPASGEGAIALAFLRAHPKFRPESVAGHIHFEPGLEPGSPISKRK